MSDVRWLGEARDGDFVALRVGRCGDDVVAEWVGTGLLRVRRDGSDVRFEPSPGADATEVEKLRRGAVQLLLRHLEGKIGLHGAAVAIEGAAAIFVGASGDGKSTLAAALCARGADLLADDASAMDRSPDGWTVVPLEEAHWLVLDGAKVRVPAKRVATAPVPVRAIFALSFVDDAERPRLVLLDGVDAVASLVPLVMRFIVDDATAQRRELDALFELVHSVAVYRFERPRDLAWLDAACDLVSGTIVK